MSVKPLDFSKHNLVIDPAKGGIKKMFEMHFNKGCNYLVKQAFEKIMAQDMYEHICACRYERTPVRSGFRNGYRERDLLTSVGLIRLEVPRDRVGEYVPECFKRYKRVHGVVDEGIKAMFLRGVSTRKVRNILDCLCGERVSASYVSQVTKALDSEVKAFENAPVDDDFAFLFLDALGVKIRLELSAIGRSLPAKDLPDKDWQAGWQAGAYGGKVKRYKVLGAYGIRRDGSRSLISFRVAHSEGTGTWRALVDYTLLLTVSAGDSDNDSVEIVLDAFWYEPDSLQAPTNPAFYDGGNPGLFTWVPAEADTDTWICSFSATDVCGAVDTHQIAIGVGFTFCGDCTEDNLIDLGDVIYLINYLFKEGPPPEPLCRGDANCDGERDLGDVVLLINYVFRHGRPPCFECCADISQRPLTRPDSPK